ncbi:3,4-dihydroxy-2-butanone-4-phosphate synthase, partial [Mycobacterium tuberculosis]
MKTTDVRVRRAITAMAGGHAVVLTGDPNGDGYLVFAAQAATPRLVAFAVRHTSGYLRVALPGAECERLHLPPMCDRDTTHCVSVDVRGTGTGISASDRAWTIAALASATSVAADFQRP